MCQWMGRHREGANGVKEAIVLARRGKTGIRGQKGQEARLGIVIICDNPTQLRASNISDRKAVHSLHSRSFHPKTGEPPSTGRWALLWFRALKTWRPSFQGVRACSHLKKGSITRSCWAWRNDRCSLHRRVACPWTISPKTRHSILGSQGCDHIFLLPLLCHEWASLIDHSGDEPLLSFLGPACTGIPSLGLSEVKVLSSSWISPGP